MPNKIALIIGIFLVTGAGFIFASTRDGAPIRTPLPPATTIETAVSTSNSEDTTMPAKETVAQPEFAVFVVPEPEPQPQATEPTPEPAPAPQPVSTPAPVPQEESKQKSALLSPVSTSGLEGLWKLDRELMIDNATGNVIKEDHFNIYTAFKGYEQCLTVSGEGIHLSCTGGYAAFTINVNGVITDADGFDNYRYKNGELEAIYVQGNVTKRQIFKKVSSAPPPGYSY